MRHLVTTLVVLAALVAGLPARAQQEAKKAAANPFQKLVQLDANNDRAIEETEVPEAGRAAFRRLLERGDTNKDGKLQLEELRALGEKVREGIDPEMMRQRLAAMDANGDGKVSREEFRGRPEMFDRLDTNKDGFISKDDAPRAAGAGAGAATPKKAANARAAAAAGPIAQRLRAMDRDGDGKISRAEFAGRPAMFDRLDTDKDGFLTVEELRAARPAGEAKAKAEGDRKP